MEIQLNEENEIILLLTFYRLIYIHMQAANATAVAAVLSIALCFLKLHYASACVSVCVCVSCHPATTTMPRVYVHK